jgi:hypothetical protein
MSQVIQVSGDYAVKTGVGKTITLDTGPEIGRVLITGDLYVDGNTTSINTTNLEIEDNIIRLNVGDTGPGITQLVSGLEIERGSKPDVRLIFDEQSPWFDPVTDENKLGAWVLVDATETLRSIQVSSISSKLSSDIVFNLQNEDTVLRVANSDSQLYSDNILDFLEDSDNKIPTVRTLRDYVNAGGIDPGIADVDKIYKKVGSSIVSRIQTYNDNIDFFINESSELKLTNTGIRVTKDLAVNGGDLTTTATTFNLINTTANIVNFARASTDIQIGATSGTAVIHNANTVIAGDLAVYGGNLTTSPAATTFNLVNTYATTVNFAGTGTAVTIGATTGTTTIRNANTVVTGDLAVNGGDLTTAATTFNLANTTATTVNLAGAGTNVNIGSASGNTTVNNNLIVNSDVSVNGGDLTTTQSSFNLINAVATTVNFGGAATEINIGNTSGSTSINDINIAGNVISNVSGNDILFDGVLSLSNQSTVPSTPVGNVKMYSTNEPGGGGTGLYFVNTTGTNDELISRSKAFIYSLIL